MGSKRIALPECNLKLPFNARWLVMEYHRNQVEFKIRSQISRLIDEYSKVGQSVVPRYTNGGEYPRRRVDQDLFVQSVPGHYKTYELLQQ